MTMTQQRPESKELTILIKLLKMTTSTHDHEALSAIRLANTQLLKLGTDWEDLLYAKVTLVADPFTGIPDVSNSAPRSGAAPSQPYNHRSPPPQPQKPATPKPPPAPVYYSDVTEINGYFDKLMWIKLSHSVQQTITAAEKRWRKDKRLDSADYNNVRFYAMQKKAPKIK
jgi:hypothetical protein